MAFKADTDKIKRWREERQWSQEHMAELAGVGLRTVQRIETGGTASLETLKALAAAFDVDVTALSIDQKAEAAKMIREKNEKGRATLRLSFFIHLASYVLGAVIFVVISVNSGAEYFLMKIPLMWWTVGLVSHAVTVVIVEVTTRYQEQYETI